MSQEQPKQLRRIENLEKKIAKLESLLAGGRRNRVSKNPQVRLAQTARSSSEYPVDGNTFAIRFLDPEFTEAEGTQVTGGEYQEDTYQRFAHTIPNSYIGEDTNVFVVEIDGQHYIIPPGGGGGDCACDILELIELLHPSMSLVQQAKFLAVKTACGCVQEEEIETVDCNNCADNKMPKYLDVTINNIGKASYNTQDWNLTAVDVAGGFSKKHELTVANCLATSGFTLKDLNGEDTLYFGEVTAIFDPHPTLSHMTWWINIAITYFGFPVCSYNYYADDKSGDCLASYAMTFADETSRTEQNGPYLLLSNIDITVEPSQPVT